MSQIQPIILPAQKSAVSPIITIAIVGGLGYFAYSKLKDYFDKEQAKKDLTTDQGSNVTVNPKSTDPRYRKLLDLNGKPIKTVNLATIATDLNKGLHTEWYKPADQQRIVRAFKNTPFGFVKDLEKLYLNKYAENLKELMMDKLNDENFIKVKHFFAY